MLQFFIAVEINETTCHILFQMLKCSESIFYPEFSKSELTKNKKAHGETAG